MTARRTAVHPLAAMDAAKAAVAAKADRAPETLSADDLKLLRGAKILELGNAGRLRHLGLGLPLPKSSARAAAPKGRTSGSARALLTDADLEKMSGDAISKAMAAGQVAGIAPRRRPRRR